MLAIEDKSENKAQQGALFTVAGADAFTDVFEDENTTLWKLENGDAKMTMSLTDDKYVLKLHFFMMVLNHFFLISKVGIEIICASTITSKKMEETGTCDPQNHHFIVNCF